MILSHLRVFVLVLASFAPIVAQADDSACITDSYGSAICVGDRVIDSGNYVGTVKELFANGATKVTFDWDGYTALEDRQISQLAKSVSCFNAICAGDRVVDTGNYAGTVQLVFDNGAARAVFDGFGASENRTVQQLSKLAACYNGLCVGDRVIDANNYVGTVKAVFENGQAKVTFDWDGYTALEDRQVSQLAKSVSCYNGVCVSDRVIDRSNYVGTVQLVFENGKTRVVFDGYGASENRNVTELSKQL